MDRETASFAINQTSVSNGGNWRNRKSGLASYQLSDFDMPNQKQSILSKYANVFKIFFLGLLAILLLVASIVYPIDALDNMEIWGQKPISFSNITAVLILMIFSFYSILIVRNSISNSNMPDLSKLKSAVPTWHEFQFYLGLKGICIDAGHVWYFLEWDAVHYVNHHANTKLVLSDPQGEHLTIPKRFFDAGGGDMSWHELKSYIKMHNKHAQWADIV